MTFNEYQIRLGNISKMLRAPSHCGLTTDEILDLLYSAMAEYWTERHLPPEALQPVMRCIGPDLYDAYQVLRHGSA